MYRFHYIYENTIRKSGIFQTEEGMIGYATEMFLGLKVVGYYRKTWIGWRLM